MKQHDSDPAVLFEGEVLTKEVPPSLSGMRADSAAAELFGLSRSAAERHIAAGDIYALSPVGEAVALIKKSAVTEGQLLCAAIPAPMPSEVVPEDIPLQVIYEDSHMIVINKPVGMVVHPAPGHSTGTLVAALLHHCKGQLSGIGGVMRPGIVHRIDKDTSGLITVAKTDAAHTSLAAQLEDHSMYREYRAIVVGGFKGRTEGTVDAPIARHPTDRKRMAVVAGGRSAVTHFTVDREYGGLTILKLRLETGRTHQIRVHMSHIGHPVLGDPVYGGDRTEFQRRHPAPFRGQCLHAERLTLTHPATGELVSFTAPLPDHFTEIVRLMDATL